MGARKQDDAKHNLFGAPLYTAFWADLGGTNSPGPLLTRVGGYRWRSDLQRFVIASDSNLLGRSYMGIPVLSIAVALFFC